VRGQQHGAAGGYVPADEAIDQRDAVQVEIRVRLVEQP